MTPIQSFHIEIPDETLKRIRARVADYPWHEMPDDGGWEYGTNLDYMKELCAYWVEEFDWRKQEAAINRFSHFIAPVDGIDIHFIHEKGTREKSGGMVRSTRWRHWPGPATSQRLREASKPGSIVPSPRSIPMPPFHPTGRWSPIQGGDRA